MIDFHCHVDLYPDPHAIVKECMARDMDVLSVTTTPSAWKVSSALAENTTKIRAALGLHPQLARERKQELSLFDSLLPTTRFVGEVGLDGSPELKGAWRDQLGVFEHVLSSCQAAGGKILSIHSRRAAPEVLRLIESYHGAGKFILHWYSGGYKDLEKAIELGCWFSVGPSMISGEKGYALVSKMPPERVLTESDGPFTSIDGRRLMPWDINEAVGKLAKLWQLTAKEAELRLDNNLQSLLA